MTRADSGEPVPGQEPVRKTLRRWIRASVTDWFSVIIAGVAAFVSLISLQQSRQAQDAAQRAQERERAMRVGFFTQPSLQPPKLYVVNRNFFDIRDATITFEEGYHLKVGVVPACAIWSLVGYSPPNSTWTLPFPARLDFADADDPPGHWTVDDKLRLKRQESKPYIEESKSLIKNYGGQIQLNYLTSCS